MSRSDRERTTRRENAILEEALRRLLPDPGGPPATDPLRILNLACGPCRESQALVNVMRDRHGPREVHFTGADIRDREIAEARARAAAARTPGAEFEFLATDCSAIAGHLPRGDRFDLTFLRHQNYWNDPKSWRRIFEAGLEKLRDDGLLVITSYFDREHALAVRALQDAGAVLVANAANPDTIALPTPGKSVDRHLAVFRRP